MSGQKMRRAPASPPDSPVASDARLRGFIGYGLKRAFLPVQEDLADVLMPLGLRMTTFSALGVVMGSPGLSQSQLAELLKIRRSGAVVVVDELERAGAITRQRVQSDRRAYALHATPDGAALWTRAEAAVTAHEARLFDDLTAPEQETLRALLSKAARSAARRNTGDLE